MTKRWYAMRIISQTKGKTHDNIRMDHHYINRHRVLCVSFRAVQPFQERCSGISQIAKRHEKWMVVVNADETIIYKTNGAN